MTLTAVAVALSLQFYPWGVASFIPLFFLLKHKRWIAVVGIVVVLLGYGSIYKSKSMDGQVFSGTVVVDSDGKGYYGGFVPVCSTKVGVLSGTFQMKWQKYHCAVPVNVNAVKTPLFSLRSAMEDRLTQLKSGTLLNALVLGSPLPVRIQEQAIKTGILHVFAISGLQTTLLMGYVYRWSKNKLTAMLFGSFLIFFYGFSASVLRSVLMYGVMLSIPRGRKLSLGGVAAAGLVASFIDPLFFTRTASLLSLVGAAAVVYWGDAKWPVVKTSLTLLPVSLFFFHSISLLSVVSTVILVPVFTLLYALGILYLIMPLKLVGMVVDAVGMAILSLHEMVELLPAWLVVNFSSKEVLLVLLGVALTVLLRRWWIPVLTCVAVLLLPAQSRVIFLDVGQGSATLVQKGSYGLLIDTSDKSVVLRDLRWYGIRHLGLIISHDDKDHNGMQDQVTRSFHPMLMDPYEGDVVNFGPIRAEIVWPPRGMHGTDNELSKVVYLPQFDGLITGDVPAVYLPNGSYGFFTVPHHGAKLTELNLTSSAGIISVGKNSYGHPNAQTLEILEDRGIKVYRTDQCGDIIYERNRFSCSPN